MLTYWNRLERINISFFLFPRLPRLFSSCFSFLFQPRYSVKEIFFGMIKGNLSSSSLLCRLFSILSCLSRSCCSSSAPRSSWTRGKRACHSLLIILNNHFKARFSLGSWPFVLKDVHIHYRIKKYYYHCINVHLFSKSHSLA